jgi:hypothetical protein
VKRQTATPSRSAGERIRQVPTPAARIATSSLSLPRRLNPVAVPVSTDIGTEKMRIFGRRLKTTSEMSWSGVSVPPKTSANLAACCVRRMAVRTTSERHM